MRRKTCARWQTHLALAAACWALMLATPVWGQLGFRPRGNEQAVDQILLAPRPLTRLLREGKSAIDEKRYSDGIAVLGTLLLQEDREDLPEDALRQDFFIEASGEGYYKSSVRGEALRLLGSIPEEGRKTLEIQYGVAARQALQAAVAERDIEAIGEIARKYYHTDAGYDASILLAEDKLIRGFPIAAAGILQRLIEYPAPRKRFGSQLISEVASAWMQAGRTDLAAQVLEQGLKLFAGAKIQLGSQPVTLDKSQDWKQLLSAAYPTQSKAEARSLKNWMMAGGEADRNGSVEAGLPLPTVTWDMTLHRDRGDEENVAMVAMREAQAGAVLLPKIEARMVGNVVLAKTATSNIFAIDLQTGLRLWPFYKHLAPVELAPRGASLPLELEEIGASTDLKNRIWGSSAFGQFSCDTNQLYYISGPDDHQFDQPIFNQFGRSNGLVAHNFLTGVSLQGEGKVVWHVGGPDGQNEPELAGAYFLGPPLSFEGDLYTLVEINLETRLAVLDARTGKLQWSQQLTMSPMSAIAKDLARQAQALSPSIADAVVVCPAGNGAIIAVDLLSRSLLWAKQYPTNTNDRNQFQALNNFADGMDSFDPIEERWQEPQVLIHDGQIVFTPPETNTLMCIDLLTGLPRWQQARGGARYIAGVHNDRIILVNNTGIFALNLSDGRPSWSADIPLSSSVNGNASTAKPAGAPNQATQVQNQTPTRGQANPPPAPRPSLAQGAGGNRIGPATGSSDASGLANGGASNALTTRSTRDRESVAGKSVRDGRYLYVPTSAQRVLKIDLDEGKLVDAAEVDQPLGNLFSFQDRMISVGSTRITCYYTRDALSQTVETRLAANAQDTWALNQKALILMADKKVRQAIELLRRSYAIREDDGETRYLLVNALLAGLEEDFDGYLELATELEPIIESQHFRFLVLLVKGNLRTGENELAFSRLLELMRERLHTRQPSSQSRVEMMPLGEDHEVDIDVWIGAQLAVAYDRASPEQRERMLKLVTQRVSAAGRSHPLTRQMELQYLAWLEVAQPALLALGESMLGSIDQVLGERLLQPVLNSTSAALREKAQAALARTASEEDAATAAALRNGDQFAITDGRRVVRIGQSMDVPATPVDWPRGMVEARVSVSDGPVSYGQNRLEQTGTRYGRPPIEVGLSSDHLAIFNQLGQVLSICEFERSNVDGVDPFLRCQVDGGLIFLETQSELAAFDIVRGRESAQEALLWRVSLSRGATNSRTPAGQATVHTPVSPLGIQKPFRGAALREAIVGPVTPVGILIQKGSDLVMLRALTGDTIWSRGGYDDRTTLARDGLEVAVMHPSTGKIDVLDCRDGGLLRQLDYRDDWQTWFVHGRNAVQTVPREAKASGGAIQVEANSATAVRVMDMFDGKVLLEQDLEPLSRAASCQDRFAVVLTPSGKLWYCDAATGKVVEHEVAARSNLERVRLQRFGERLVLLTNYIAANAQVGVLPVADDSKGLVPINGSIVGLSVNDGSMLWDRPARLTNFVFANSQPRLSPFMVCYRVLKPNRNSGGVAHLVAIDLRDGTLGHFNTGMTLTNDQTYEFAMEIASGRPVVRVSVGRYTTTLTATDQDKPPQPIAHFGAIEPPRAARAKGPFDFFSPTAP